MRLTIVIFAKSGAIKTYQSIPVPSTEVDGIITGIIEDYFDKSVWIGELDAVTHKDEFGWTKTRHNSETGERSLVIFYKGK